MVDIKNLSIQGLSFMGIHLHLPGYPIYFILSTKTILASDKIDIRHFHKNNHVAVMLVSHRYGFEEMLKSTVIQANEEALKRGVHVSMCGEEALILCEKKKT